jgi:hypothetical protein
LFARSSIIFFTFGLLAMMSNGVRNTHAWSVIEEVGCILWAEECLGIK